MIESQPITTIEKDELLSKVASVFADGHRLVQICCTTLADKLVVDYTFDKDYKFLGLRVNLPLENPALPSISGIVLAAFTYENELHDLFGIKISGIAVDFGGKFYRKDELTPFNKPQAPASASAKEA